MSQSVGNVVREKAVKASVHAARVKFLLVQSPAGIVISPLACLSVSLALVQEVEFSKLLAWSLGMIFLAVVRFAIWKRSPRGKDVVTNAAFWEWTLGTTMVCVALWWGVGATFVLPGSADGDLLVYCSVVMMAAGTSSLYAVHPIATSISVLCLLLPLALSFAFSHHTMVVKILSFGSLLLAAGILRGVQTLNHYLVRSHELTYDLEDNVRLLERSEKMRNDLTLMLVHDLRTPLSALITRAQMAREYTEEKDVEESLDEIQKTEELARSLVLMVSSILDVSRMESDQFPLTRSLVTTGKLVDVSLENVAGEIVVQGPTDLRLECDVDLISRVITNLLGNALRYQPFDEPVQLQISDFQGTIEFRVSDLGPGIRKEDQGRIFDKYAQTSGAAHAYTSGLGLTFCKLAVEQHKGFIGVHSELGEGSQFWIRLPSLAEQSPSCEVSS